MLVLSTKYSSSVRHLYARFVPTLCTFVEFLLRLCLFGSGAQRKIRIKACLRTSVYLSLWDIAPYCPVTSCNVQFYFPSSVLIVQGQLNLSHFCAPRSLLA